MIHRLFSSSSHPAWPPRVSVPEHQRDVHTRLMDIGFPVRIARSVDDAKRAVWDWGLPSLDASLKGEKLA